MTVAPFDPVMAVLLIPIGSAALLAILPGYRQTARLNVAASLATFLSALSLFVIERPQPTPYVLVDDLNIVFIVLNTFVGFTTSIFSASYIAHELDTGRLTPGLPAFLPRHVSDHDVRYESGVRIQQYRFDVGCGRNRDAEHGADGWHLPHPRRSGSGVEIFHPGQCRNCFCAVRHDPGLHGGAAGRRRGSGRHGVDTPDPTCGEFRPCPSQRRFRIPGSRLRDQGRPGAAARVAARRACRGAYADIGRAIGPAFERRALCIAALQDIACRQSGGNCSGTPDGDDGSALARFRSVHALPSARHQAAVRLFLDRTYGHYRFCVRNGRPAGQFCRPVAHGHAQPDEVGDFLRRRPYFAGQGHATDQQDPGPDRDSSGTWLGSGDGGRRDCRIAAARHIHERISRRELHLRTASRCSRSSSCSGFCWPSAL